MTFKHKDDYLEKSLESGELNEADLDRIIEISNRIDEPNQMAIEYVRDVAAAAEKYQLKDLYVFIGGYAILGNLVNRFGDSIISAWRGSNDIDMIGSIDFLNSVLRSNYRVLNDRKSPNIEDKWTLKLDTFGTGDNRCKFDYVLLEENEIKKIPYRESKLLGIPIKVINPLVLIRGKIEPAKEEAKHLNDIVDMFGVLEYEKVNPYDVIRTLSAKDRFALRDLLCAYQKQKPKDRFSFGPTTKYLRELRKGLRCVTKSDYLSLTE